MHIQHVKVCELLVQASGSVFDMLLGFTVELSDGTWRAVVAAKTGLPVEWPSIRIGERAAVLVYASGKQHTKKS
jgi:hypothetical protein